MENINLWGNKNKYKIMEYWLIVRIIKCKRDDGIWTSQTKFVRVVYQFQVEKFVEASTDYIYIHIL